ncbi:MAG: hypothetical protein LBC53_06700 [Spirochaetaceae bacterium]|jgi:hypothetical protein|nr:hypothetical protein [Spirochaetaceae bacterium]
MNNENAAMFFYKYKRPVLAFIIIVTAFILGMVAYFAINEIVTKAATLELENLVAKYEELNPDFGSSEGEAKEKADALLAEIEAFAKKSGGYAGARAWSMAAGVYAERKDWEKGASSYVNSAKKAKNGYLAPVSWYNAAVCAEENGKDADAKAFLEKSLTYKDFPLAARVRFSIARILEKTDVEKALEAYRALINAHEKETGWVNLSQSRIIALETGWAAGAGDAETADALDKEAQDAGPDAAAEETADAEAGVGGGE